MRTDEGRRRVVIEGVRPEIDCGRFPVKRTVGETVEVEADVFADGHDELACVLRYRHEDEAAWAEVAMEPVGNDRWRGRFAVSELGSYRYTLGGWVDRFATWRRDLAKKAAAGQDVSADLPTGADLIERTARRARGAGRDLRARARRLRAGDLQAGLEPELASLMRRHPDRRLATS